MKVQSLSITPLCVSCLLSTVLFFATTANALILSQSALEAELFLDKQKSSSDIVTIWDKFKLDPGSTGADPATEAVTLTVGSFSQTIPPLTFARKHTKQKMAWTFKGAAGGFTKVIITQKDKQWTLKAAASGITLAGTTNPVTLSLQIGDDAGNQAFFFVVTEKPEQTLFKFPAGEVDDADGDGFSKQGDCDDQNPLVFPDASELCDGADNNCNGQTDEGFTLGVSCTVGEGGCQQRGVTACALSQEETICEVSPGGPGPSCSVAECAHEDQEIFYGPEGLIVHAIDVNHNGQLDPEELDYGDTAQREGWYWLGVWIRENILHDPWVETPPRKLTFDDVLNLLEPRGDGVFVRAPGLDPTGERNGEHLGFTRDQMIPLVAAMGVWGRTDALQRLWEALPEDILGKHDFQVHWLNWVTGQTWPSDPVLDVDKRVVFSNC